MTPSYRLEFADGIFAVTWNGVSGQENGHVLPAGRQDGSEADRECGA